MVVGATEVLPQLMRWRSDKGSSTQRQSLYAADCILCNNPLQCPSPAQRASPVAKVPTAMEDHATPLFA